MATRKRAIRSDAITKKMPLVSDIRRLTRAVNQTIKGYYESGEQNEAFEVSLGMLQRAVGKKASSNKYIAVGNLKGKNDLDNLLMQRRELENFLTFNEYTGVGAEMREEAVQRNYESFKKTMPQFEDMTIADYMNMMTVVDALDKDLFKELYGENTNLFGTIYAYHGQLKNVDLIRIIQEEYNNSMESGSEIRDVINNIELALREYVNTYHGKEDD